MSTSFKKGEGTKNRVRVVAKEKNHSFAPHEKEV
jgi:hypothetical protein